MSPERARGLKSHCPDVETPPVRPGFPVNPRISAMTTPATPPLTSTPDPSPAPGNPPATNGEDLPWTGITVMIAVMSLLLFMAVPMTGPTEADRAEARLDRRCYLALEELRTAIDDYQGDHGSWPGQTAASLRSLAPPTYDAYSLTQQLQLNTDLAGTVLPSGGESHPFGPYLPNGIPINPLNGKSRILVVQPGESFETTRDRGFGWVYNPLNGDLRPAGQPSDPGL